VARDPYEINFAVMEVKRYWRILRMWRIRGGVLPLYKGRVMLFMAELLLLTTRGRGKVVGGVVEPGKWLLVRQNIPTSERGRMCCCFVAFNWGYKLP